jgi:glycosyltransferase involved in cell wall biosynthesis
MSRIIYADVTRLLIRNIRGIRHTGIDRVNLEYARWVHRQGGGLCLRRGTELKQLSRDAWGEFLLGEIQPGHPDRRKRQQISFLLRALAFRRSVPHETTVAVTTHSWLACQNTWSWVKSRRKRAFVFIHDLIPIQFPEYSHPREKNLHLRRLDNTLIHSTGIIVNSQCTESAVRSHAKKVRLAVPPILIAPLGHNLPPTTFHQPHGRSHPYFVILGTIEPRKNHLLLLTIWRELVKLHGQQTPHLIVVGRRGWECEQVVDLLERCEAIHPFLIERKNASDTDVSALLHGARALLMPSFAEGFGMPVQEALAMGTPVISSPLPAIKEFARNIPDYALPHDGVRWLELIEDYTRPDSPQRQSQMRRLQAFQRNEWHEHFAKVDQFIKTLE